jgi:hypothetical protein
VRRSWSARPCVQAYTKANAHGLDVHHQRLDFNFRMLTTSDQEGQEEVKIPRLLLETNYLRFRFLD